MNETKEEKSARLFKSMWVDKDGNHTEPPCTEKELIKYMKNIKDAFDDFPPIKKALANESTKA